jgi:hypothetical protein
MPASRAGSPRRPRAPEPEARRPREVLQVPWLRTAVRKGNLLAAQARRDRVDSSRCCLP